MGPIHAYDFLIQLAARVNIDKTETVDIGFVRAYFEDQQTIGILQTTASQIAKLINEAHDADTGVTDVIWRGNISQDLRDTIFASIRSRVGDLEDNIVIKHLPVFALHINEQELVRRLVSPDHNMRISEQRSKD